MTPFLATLAIVAAPQDPGAPTRDLVMRVCVPYVADSVSPAPDVLRELRLSLPVMTDGQRELQTRDKAHIVRLSGSDGRDTGNVRRVCVVQARAGGFERAFGAVKAPLESAGFAPSPDAPADWPVWTRDDIAVSVHQNPGRATVIRVSYSTSLDDED